MRIYRWKLKTIAFIFLLGIYLSMNAQEKPLGWDYPVKPGMEEWKKFQSNKEMIDACQIPEEVLFSLSTEYLAELCLHYPLLYDIFAFDNLNTGLDKLFSDFNGVSALFKREDILQSLTKQYIQKLQSLSFLEGNNKELEKGSLIVSVSALEVLMSRIPTGKEEYKEILENLVSGYEKKVMYTDYFKGFGFRTNFYSRVHVIVKMDKQSLEKLPLKENNSSLFSGIADEQTVSVINELSYQLIK